MSDNLIRIIALRPISQWEEPDAKGGAHYHKKRVFYRAYKSDQGRACTVTLNVTLHGNAEYHKLL
jgi:hypothetical protein